MFFLSRLPITFVLGFTFAGCIVTTPPPTFQDKGNLNYLTGHPAILENGLINVVVEIPAGTNAKWEVSKNGATIEWEQKDGKPRVVQYLSYPGNYGIVPRTQLSREQGGDGDPLDIVLLGPALERGSVVMARPIGVLHLLDDGERDDKILAVPITGPLSDVTDLQSLEKRYAGISLIIETWFTHYKGPGHLQSQGINDSKSAIRVIQEASAYFEKESASNTLPKIILSK